MTNAPLKVATMSANFGAMNTARVLIAASPAQVWALLFDRSVWMAGYAGKVRVAGLADTLGERALYHSDHGDGEFVTRLEEILYLDAPRRLVLRLASRDDSATTAFVDWRVAATSEGTLLELNVYWLDVPAAGMEWPAVQALRAEYETHTQELIDGHLRRIRNAAVQYELRGESAE
jgi:uncharacterized protein YndB with AHSA1/START domain